MIDYDTFAARVEHLERAYEGASFWDMPNLKVAIHKACEEFNVTYEEVTSQHWDDLLRRSASRR
jgi:hypothetical protein